MHGAPQNPAEHPLPQLLSLWGPRLSPICPPRGGFALGPVPAAPAEPCARGEGRGGGRRLSSSPRLNFPSF